MLCLPWAHCSLQYIMANPFLKNQFECVAPGSDEWLKQAKNTCAGIPGINFGKSHFYHMLDPCWTHFTRASLHSVRCLGKS